MESDVVRRLDERRGRVPIGSRCRRRSWDRRLAAGRNEDDHNNRRDRREHPGRQPDKFRLDTRFLFPYRRNETPLEFETCCFAHLTSS